MLMEMMTTRTLDSGGSIATGGIAEAGGIGAAASDLGRYSAGLRCSAFWAYCSSHLRLA